MFSISWSALEAPSKTELTPSLRRHQAGAGGKVELERGPAAPSGSPVPPALLTDGELGQRAAQALGDGLQLLQLRLLPPALLAQDLVLQPLVSLGGREDALEGVLCWEAAVRGPCASRASPNAPGRGSWTSCSPGCACPITTPPSQAHLQRGAGVGGDAPVVLP